MRRPGRPCPRTAARAVSSGGVGSQLVAEQHDLEPNSCERQSSKVRVRITAVSLGHGISMGKIGVTCRQPYLGALEWIEEEVAKAQKHQKAEARAA